MRSEREETDHREREIVERAACGLEGAPDSSGAPDALGQVLERHRPRLERMVEFRMDERMRGRVDAADVVQECFTHVITQLPSFLAKEGMAFFVWLRLETAKHLHASHRRHFGAQARDVRAEVPLVVPGGLGASSFALASAILDRATPSRAAMKDEQNQRLVAAVEGMKEADREVLMLRSFEQLDNQEVAQVLGLSESAATLRYVRALKRLESILANLEIVSEGFG